MNLILISDLHLETKIGMLDLWINLPLGPKLTNFFTVIKLIDLPYVKYSLVLKPLLANHWPGFP